MKYTSTLKLFVKGYGRYKVQIIILVLLGFASGLLEGVGVTALVPLFSRLTGGGEANDIISRAIGIFLGWFGLGFGLKALLVFVGAAFIVKAIVLIISQYISIRISSDYEKEMRSLLFEETLKTKWIFLLNQKVGYLETILIKDIDMARGLLVRMGMVMVTIASLLVYIAIAFSISPTITLLSLALGGTIFLIIKPFIYRIKELSREAAYMYSEMAHHVNENIIGLKTVKTSSVEGHISRRAEQHFNLLKYINIRIGLIRTISSVILEPVSVIFVLGIFAFSYLTGSFEIGVFAATMYLINRVFKQIQAVQSILYLISERIPYLEKVVNFHEAVVANRELYKGTKPFAFQNYLQFRNVGFFYPGRKRKILSHFTFSVKRGEVIGIIGESGSGKTTLVDLLLRLLEPASGKILVDGTDIAEIDIGEWRKNIGYVSQDIFIINDTIENNIRFYDETVSDKDIVRGAKMASIYDFIQSQPQKFKTQVGERGVMISGGEKQRLVLARYLARNPKILILDEATSALDNKSELMIQEAIEGIKGKITIFVIAHRLSSILNCDKVIFLEKGRVGEEGYPADLLKDKSSRFYKLYNIG